MYLYYCGTPTPNTGRIPVSEDKLEQIKRERAFHITPLAVSELAPENWENVKYRGDWWFDVDEPNLGDAITSLHGLMDALEKLDVNLEHLRYFASGSKGFHVRVPASLFDGDREQRHLPEIYKQMALRLICDYQIKGLDLNLYNGKTGHLLRVENKPRPDGKFKVPITLAEARTITVEQYAELTRQPREIAVPSVPADVRAEGLAKMYAECRITAESLPENTKRAGSSADLAVLNGKIPRCVLWLTQNKDTNSQWNAKAMQLIAFRQAAGLDDELLEAAARNHKGDSQRTPSDLLSALEAKQGSRIQWSCAATNALFARSPCGGCPLNSPRGYEASNDDTHTPTNDVGEVALGHLLRHSAVLEMNGRVYMVNTRDGIHFNNPNEQRLKYENKPLYRPTQNREGFKRVNPVDEWIRHPERRSYTGLTYSTTEDPDKINLFTGFAVEPDPDHAKCKLFLRHTFEVIAGGNQEHFGYILDWLAWQVQDISTDRPGVAVVLKTRMEGTGKSLWAGYLGRLWGEAYFPVGSGQYVFERFNSQLRGKRLLFLDEVVYGGNKQHRGGLYTLLTEPSLTIEEKGIPAVTCPNAAWMVMATNNEWAVPAGETARRFFMPSVSEHRAGDFAYFRLLVEEMENGGPGALLHFLQQRSFEKDRVRNAPKTAGLLEQKLLSLDSKGRWLHEILVSGGLDGTDPLTYQPMVFSMTGETDITRETMYRAYVEAAGLGGERFRAAQTALGRFLTEVGVVVPGEHRNGGRRVYRFKSLGVMRERFAQWLGQPVEWGG